MTSFIIIVKPYQPINQPQMELATNYLDDIWQLTLFYQFYGSSQCYQAYQICGETIASTSPFPPRIE
jgi:hypothetical protein